MTPAPHPANPPPVPGGPPGAPAPTVQDRAGDLDLRAVGLLLAGALCIAWAPILVKLSPLGPQATAFWRLALAIPPLAVWAIAETRARDLAPRGGAAGAAVPAPAGTSPPGPARGPGRRPWGLMAVAGLLFAGDLITWHAGIVRTSAANATFLANLTPVVVVLAAWAVSGTLPARPFLLAVAVALAGSLLMSGGAPGTDPQRLLGDALSAATSLWYAAYLMVTARVRGTTGTGTAMLVTTAVAAPVTLVATLAAGEPLLPPASGIASLGVAMAPVLVLAWIVHVGGQGLLALGLGRVGATLASVLILVQPVGAAVLGWVVLDEALGPVQIAGAALVLAGVWLARRPVPPAPARPA